MIKVWTALPEMMVARSNHSLTVLPGGEGGGWGGGGLVVIVGGRHGLILLHLQGEREKPSLERRNSEFRICSQADCQSWLPR